MPTSRDVPDPLGRTDRSLMLVVNCRREASTGSGARGRFHFKVHEVGADQVWRLSESEQVLDLLRQRIDGFCNLG